MKCLWCTHELPKDKFRCVSCGMWTPENDSGVNAGNGAVLFEDIQTEDLKRYKTGLLDDCLGGGIVVSMIALIAGTPGAGKSTLLLQVAEALCAYGLVIYIATEEDIKIIKMRGVRLKIKPRGKLMLIAAMGGVADIGALLMQHKPCAIILDSLDSLVGHDHEAEIKALEIIKKYAVSLQAVAIVISQVNKDADFTGLMGKQHAVDALLTLMPEDDLKGENGDAIRVAEVLKNRNGKAFISTMFEMTETGLVVCDPDVLRERLEAEQG